MAEPRAGLPAPQETAHPVRAAAGDTLEKLALRIFRDARVAELLAQANPGLKPGVPLAANTVVQVPGREELHKWATRRNVTVGVDPRKGVGTHEYRQWKKFGGGPSRGACGLACAPDTVLGQLLVRAEPGGVGPAHVGPELPLSGRELVRGMRDRVAWLGAGKVLGALQGLPVAALDARVVEVLRGSGWPGTPEDLRQAVCGALVYALGGEVLERGRDLLTRAFQVFSATADGLVGGIQVVHALREAPADARQRVLTALGFTAQDVELACWSLDALPEVRAALATWPQKPDAERHVEWQRLELAPGPRDAVLAALAPHLNLGELDALAVRALELDGLAQRAVAAAKARRTQVRTAQRHFGIEVTPFAALSHLALARRAVYAARGLTLDHSVFPPAGPARNLLDEAVLATVPALAQEVTDLPAAVRGEWSAVEAWGVRLLEASAGELGRGVPGLLGAAPTSKPGAAAAHPAGMRAADLLARVAAPPKGAPAARGTVVVLPVLVDLVGALRGSSRWSARGFWGTFSVSSKLRIPELSPVEVGKELLALLDLLPAATAKQPGFAKVRTLLASPVFCSTLAEQAGRAHVVLHNGEMSPAGHWACAVAWALAHAAALPAPAEAARAVGELVQREGRSLLEALHAETKDQKV